KTLSTSAFCQAASSSAPSILIGPLAQRHSAERTTGGLAFSAGVGGCARGPKAPKEKRTSRQETTPRTADAVSRDMTNSFQHTPGPAGAVIISRSPGHGQSCGIPFLLDRSRSRGYKKGYAGPFARSTWHGRRPILCAVHPPHPCRRRPGGGA